MRKLSIVAAMLMFAGGLAAQTPTPNEQAPAAKPDPKAAPALAGKWSLSVETPQGTMTNTMDLKLDGKNVTGTITSQMGTNELVGEFTDGKLTFNMSVDTPNGSLQIAWSGAFKDDGTLSGTASLGDMGQMNWTASRLKDKS
jgi:hypothetical protein